METVIALYVYKFHFCSHQLEAQVVVLESHLNRNDGVESPTKLMSELDELRGQLQLEAESSSSLKAQNRELRKVRNSTQTTSLKYYYSEALVEFE